MPNRLAFESSPYLLQHRNNPVDWFPWGPEAFAEARRRDVPIFLSIGYSTCYWCHVMERESFENPAIAAQMNSSFVCIKLDREERPDVDDIYMAAVQAFSQRGGWPMSVFLEPTSLRPFWAGTYFPAEPRFQGMPTFPQVLDGVSHAWRDNRAEVLAQSVQLADAVRERIAEPAPTIVHIGENEISTAAAHLLRLHDPIHGGFGPAPKFPQPAFLDLLLEVREVADEQTRAAIDGTLTTTLTRMALGGMFDQIGGGFHRYSVDEKWLIPHFEKMLYDNGQLASTYAYAARVLPNPAAALCARTARRICEYVIREMTAPEGAFFSAQDAEVNHREGQNYLWTIEQFQRTLPQEDAAWAARVYGLTGGPNFRDPHHPTDPPSNVLFLNEAELGPTDWSPAAPEIARLDGLNAALYQARATRDQPGTDTKILASWNGLMIAGLAATGAAINQPGFIAAAARAADFILARMRTPDGNLLRSFAAGRAAIPAFLEDYACLAHGLLALHMANPDDGRFFAAAIDLMARAERLFADPLGAYFDAPADQADLFIRPRSTHDGAMPGGASMMINNLVLLAQITGDAAHARRAARALAAISPAISQHPLNTANSTRALLRLLRTNRAALDDALSGAHTPASSHGAADNADAAVEILSAVDTVEVPAAEPIGIVLRVRIAPGYHITAADPGEGIVGVTPFIVHIVGGTGLSVYADYPVGTPDGVGGEWRVYSGEFDLPIVLERGGQWSGTPLIAVTFQPCTGDACLAPRTVELDVAIHEA